MSGSTNDPPEHQGFQLLTTIARSSGPCSPGMLEEQFYTGSFGSTVDLLGNWVNKE